jgi:hypothetical protein
MDPMIEIIRLTKSANVMPVKAAPKYFPARRLLWSEGENVLPRSSSGIGGAGFVRDFVTG